MQEGLEVADRDFFKETFSESEIRELAAVVGTENMFARRSPSLKKLGLADKELSDDEMVNLMLQEPKLIRRPLIKVGDKLMVGAGNAAVEAAIAEAG
ncbi:MAG: ArsC/Spx/MgsR family protein [Dehalococcoidia bacterium]|nr:ArsC/Spx/MgsR family protein [Dehalococcoidia bacterium]